MDDQPDLLPSLYLETSVVSYATARLSRDPLIRGHQELTRRWWNESRGSYRLFTSPIALREAERGDPVAANERLELLAEAVVLAAVPRAEWLAVELAAALRIPEKSLRDAAHLPFAVHYEMAYLLTWNCAHLANPAVLRAFADLCRERGFWQPIVCTPEGMAQTGKEN
jgi:predicted nucleic acid-binding protein